MIFRDSDRDDVRAWPLLLAVLVVLTLYRAWVIAHNALPLYLDEAQYWVWSRTPDWGYYSKPPMVAWVIRLFAGLGDDELTVRLGTLLLHPATAIVLYFLGRSLFDTRTALAAALLFITLPLVGFNSLFMTTDAPLFFFWGLSCLALWRALRDDRWRDWLLLGIAAGLGLLSKYSMAAFAPSVALVLCLPAYRAHWRNPRLYAAALLAVLIFLPNLLWNARMDFVSFRHTAEISRLDQGLFHPARLAEFLGGQILCMGPIAFAFLVGMLRRRATWRDPRLGFLASLTLPFLALISLQALLAKANVNWAAPTYFAASLLVAAGWVAHGRRRWWLVAVIVNLLLLSGFYHYRTLAELTGHTLTRKLDPYARVLGWPQLGQAVAHELAGKPGLRLAVTDRGPFALLQYYVRPHPSGMRIWNPDGRVQNHFHLTADMRHDIGADFLLVSQVPLDAAVAGRFERWGEVITLTVPLYEDFGLRLYLYPAQGFKGYAR